MSEEWCDLCDLPRSTCVHGMPAPPPPEPAVRRTPAARATRQPRAARPAAERSPRSSGPTPVIRASAKRFTAASSFQPHILAVLREQGGAFEADSLLDAVHERMTDVLLAGDHDTVGRGEPRWQLTARKARAALTENGLMEPARTPGVWELTSDGLTG